MQTFNRFIIFIKRMLSKKIYICMLLTILAITVLYMFLPEKSQSADIKVAIYTEDVSTHNDSLLNYLSTHNSLYTFYYVESMEDLLAEVKSAAAECGYYIPENFFYDYITGFAYNNPITQYVIPSSALSSVISETLFSSILTVCSKDILTEAVDLKENNQIMTDRLDYYIYSDEIFTIKDTTSGEFKYENIVFHINLPVTEVTIIMLTMAVFLGFLCFLKDREAGLYKVLTSRQALQIRILNISASLLPVLLVGLLSIFLSYGVTYDIVIILITAALEFILVLGLGYIIKRSTLLEKVLPLIMLFSIFIVFLRSIL